MSDIAIRVENLGKQYRIGKRERYRTLRDTLTDTAIAPFRRLRSTFQRSNLPPSNADNTIWALKDISFEVKRGEAVGIIGRNGAGKSTLLKILSRITEPTEGQVTIRGRVGSLLEVGTGFHPELTGRENVYLNGAILGMKRAEIERKFDEIVAFAEIEKFLDTPVKHYSSGMHVRLAFAVAAHLEPEILLVDEVLAVGDAAFQKKCLGKMGEVAREGRTVLFVSHNMGAIRSLCDRGVLLKHGQVQIQGTSGQIVDKYLSDLIDIRGTNNPVIIPESCRTKGTREVQIDSIGIQDASGTWRQQYSIWEPINLVYEIENKQNMQREISIWFSIVNLEGEIVGTSIQYDDVQAPPCIEALSRCKLNVLFQDNILPPGNYSINAGILGKNRQVIDWCEYVISFKILPTFYNGTPYDNRVGSLPFRSKWGTFSIL